MIWSVPWLLARALGVDCTGPLRCYYCGAPCDGSRPVAEFVKDSFTGRDRVATPGSPGVCAGCVLCLREACEVELIDGTRRALAKCAMRSWSWAVTAGRAVAASKAHLAPLRALCLDPPAPPFALCLSDSGQRHLLYRGVVNHARGPVVATLEGERVAYRPADLARLLGLAGRVAAACGKPALDAPDAGRAIRLLARYPLSGESLLDGWQSAAGSPPWRLASWLCPNKEESERGHPAEPGPPGHRGDPAQAGGPGRPAAEDARGGGGRRDPGRGQPTLFGPG